MNCHLTKVEGAVPTRSPTLRKKSKTGCMNAEEVHRGHRHEAGWPNNRQRRLTMLELLELLLTLLGLKAEDPEVETKANPFNDPNG